MDKMLGGDLGDMQLISGYKKTYIFLLCIIAVYSQYARVFSLKDRRNSH